MLMFSLISFINDRVWAVNELNKNAEVYYHSLPPQPWVKHSAQISGGGFKGMIP